MFYFLIILDKAPSPAGWERFLLFISVNKIPLPPVDYYQVVFILGQFQNGNFNYKDPARRPF